ncbi:MAG: M1 family aminopeptidase [Chloroflexi bacterium]|nr:M1 family aminopeptidase [Chloroflexota bacterium]
MAEREGILLPEVSCGGLLGAAHAGAAAAEDRHPFALPGDRPVWGRDRPFAVEHIALEFSFDLARRELSGVATTTFRPRTDGLREAVFDARELVVESVTDGSGRELPFRLGERSLHVDLRRPRSSRRRITTVVRYRARPRRGLYFNAPDPDDPERPRQIWTQGQAEDSAYYFPCFDYPGERATSEVTATVPAGWFVLSNGRLASRREDRRRRRVTYHWRQERPHPAYLVTLVAGELVSVEESARGAGPGGADVPVAYHGPAGSRPALRRAFGRTPEMVRFFAERIGTPYPWAKYDTVAVSDFIFGGMENTSATTMTDVLLHDARAHEDLAELCDSITAHELSHQWFGDLLTCREWSHGWLNESFATYFDSLWVEHARGWDAFRHDLREKAAAYFSEDASSYRRPLVQNVFAEPIDIFDRHLYERGAQVLDMLRYVLGDDLWWRAIAHYVSRHREGEVLTHDLQRAIEEATGRNLDWFFDQWVWKGGHPELRAAYSWDAEHGLATVRVVQGQKTAGDPLTSIYRMPLDIAFRTEQGLSTRRVELSEPSHAFVFPLDGEPRWVAIDPANRILKKLVFEPGEEQLRARLAEDLEAVGRLEAAEGLAAVGSPGAVEALASALASESETDLVRAAVASALGRVRSDAARDALVAALDSAPARVRRAAASALGESRDEVAARALAGRLRGRGDRSYYVQAAAAAALGATRQPTAYRALHRVLDRPAHNDVITAGALAGLGALRDPQALDTLLDYTARGRHLNARRAAATALGRLAPFADEGPRTRARERLAELLDDGALRIRLQAAAALSELGDARAVPALTRAATRALDGRFRRACRIAARDLAERSDKGDQVRALTDEVEQLRQRNDALRDRLEAVEARLGDGSPAAAARSTP